MRLDLALSPASLLSAQPPTLLLRTPSPLLQLADDSQDEMPLVDALIGAASSVRAPFFFPGHKMGRGAAASLKERLGLSTALRHDLPELPELDNLFAPEGAIARAQELASDAFGAERTWFLANGSTAGVLAAVLATVQLWYQRLGREDARRPIVLLPRNAHKSAYHALVASGAEPCWMTPEYDAASGICLGLASETVADGLKRHGHRVAAALLISPTYEGVLSDVSAIAALCSAAQVPLVVDEAHGAHLEFLPGRSPLPTVPGGRVDRTGILKSADADPRAEALTHRFPQGALRSGADVVVQSTHKTLGALTQAAMLHASSGALTAYPGLAGALSSALEIYQSSSPSYLLLASLDAARWDLASRRGCGRVRLLRAAHHAEALRRGVTALPCGPWALQLPSQPGVHALDPLRVTLLAPSHPMRAAATCLSSAVSDVAARAARGGGGDGGWWSLDGFGLDDFLIDAGVYAELPQAHTLTLALSLGSSRADVTRVLDALQSGCESSARTATDAPDAQDAPLMPPISAFAAAAAASAVSAKHRTEGLTPREAYFAPKRMVGADAAIGLLSAELVCPYPPGIPILLPGEEIDHQALAQLRALRDAGCSLTGCTDPSLHELAVIDA